MPQNRYPDDIIVEMEKGEDGLYRPTTIRKSDRPVFRQNPQVSKFEAFVDGAFKGLDLVDRLVDSFKKIEGERQRLNPPTQVKRRRRRRY